jgi:hypothetical protein
MAFIQGIFCVESTETWVHVYRHIYYSSRMTDTSVSLLTLVINIALYLVLTTFGTGTS